MPDFYCDHNAAQYHSGGYPASSPTWNTPEDGDGKAATGGTVATASVDFASQGSAPTSGGVSIFGSTVITPTYNATPATMATNMASAINSSTAVITSAWFDGTYSAPRVNTTVWARATGAVCEIMARVATTKLNDSGANTSIIPNFAGHSGTITTNQFTGGVSGPWRYFYNEASLPQTINGGAVTVATYGAWISTVWGNGTGAGDKIHVRSATSSTVTITIASPGVISWTNHRLTSGAPVVFSTTGALPTGITAGTTYFVISSGLTADAFQISTTVGGSAVNTSGSQSGTHTAVGSKCFSHTYSSSTLGPTSNREVTIIIDDGLKWSEAGTFTIYITNSSFAHGTHFAGRNLKFVGNGRFVIDVNVQSTSTKMFSLGSHGTGGNTWYNIMEGLELRINNSSTSGAFACIQLPAHSSSTTFHQYRYCKLRNLKSNNFVGNTIQPYGQHASPRMGDVLEGCEFTWKGLLSQPTAGIVKPNGNTTPNGTILRIKDCVFYDEDDATKTFKLFDGGFQGTQAATALNQIVFENCGGSLKTAPADISFGILGKYTGTNPSPELLSYGLLTTKDRKIYRYENPVGYTEWIGAESPWPYYNAMLDDGTLWSLRSLWFGQYLGLHCTYTAARLNMFYTATAATKTVNVYILCSDDIAQADINPCNLRLSICYIDSSGNIRKQQTKYGSTTQYAAGPAWTQSSPYNNYFSKKLTLTTEFAIKQNTEITATLSYHGVCPASTNGKYIFINPELDLT